MADAFSRSESPGQHPGASESAFHTPEQPSIDNPAQGFLPQEPENAANQHIPNPPNPQIPDPPNNPTNFGNSANPQNPSFQDFVNILRQSFQQPQPQSPHVQPHFLHHDLEYVVPNRSAQISITRDCPTKLSDRRIWLKTVEVILSNSTAGIRWMESQAVLACKNSLDSPNIFTSTFTFDRVIPLLHIFRAIDGNLFVTQQDVSGQNFVIQISDRVLQAISRRVYAILLSKIPENSQQLLESVDSHDGIALIKALRCQTDNIHQTLVESLRDRKSALSLTAIADWPQTKSNLVNLFQDWQQAVLDGAVQVGDSLTPVSFKHLVAEVCDAVLPGTYEWVHNPDNSEKSWRACLDYCDMLCRAQAKRLLARQKQETIGMLSEAATAASDNQDAYAEDATSFYRHQRRRYVPPPRAEQRAPYAGRGAGRTRDTWMGGYSGYSRGGGKGRGRGRGRGRGYAYVAHDRPRDRSNDTGKRPRTGKLLSCDEWIEEFRAFQQQRHSHSHAAISEECIQAEPSPSTNTPPPAASNTPSDVFSDNVHDRSEETDMHDDYTDDHDDVRFQ